MKFTLREDQVKVVNSVLTLLNNPKAHPLVHICVGGGKTSAIASTLIDEHFVKTLQDNEIIIFLVHTEVLARQAYETFKKTLHNLNYEVGIIGGAKLKKFQNFKAKVQVAMKDTFKNHLPRFKNEYKWVVKYAIVDEMHNCGAKQYRNLLENLIENDNTRCIGLSATPERMDAQATYPFRPEWTVEGLQNKDAIALKVNAPYKLYAPQIYDSKDAKMKGEDYDLQAMSEAEQKKGSTSVLFNPDIKKALSLLPADIKIKGLVFCIDTNHIYSILNNLVNNGYKASAITGYMNADEKDIALDKLKTGEIDFLVTCNVLNEGFDLPEVNVLICLRPTMTPRIFLQQYGRGARYVEGKVNHIFDIAGNHKDIGLPDDDRGFAIRTVLLKDKNKAGGVYKSNGGFMVCAKCYVVIQLIDLTCPHCGFLNIAKEQKYSPEQLVLIKESAEQKIKEAKAEVTADIVSAITNYNDSIVFFENLNEEIKHNQPPYEECFKVFKEVAAPELFKECFVEVLSSYIKDESRYIDIIKNLKMITDSINRIDRDRSHHSLIRQCIGCLEGDKKYINIIFDEYKALNLFSYKIAITSADKQYYSYIIKECIIDSFNVVTRNAKQSCKAHIDILKHQEKNNTSMIIKDTITDEYTELSPRNILSPFCFETLARNVKYIIDINDGREIEIILDNTPVETNAICYNSVDRNFSFKHNKKSYLISIDDFATFIATSGFRYKENSLYVLEKKY